MLFMNNVNNAPHTQSHGLHVNPRHAIISQFNSFPISLWLRCAKQTNLVHVDDVVDDVVDEASQPEGQSNVAAVVHSQRA